MMLIDNSYKRTGNIEPTKILQLIDISEEVKNRQNEVNKKTIELCNSLTDSGVPKEKIGEKCFKPFECDFKSILLETCTRLFSLQCISKEKS